MGKVTLEETWEEIKTEAKVDVFTRLAEAVAASESIPALVAEINAVLPEGYEVREKSRPEAESAEDMSDPKNWKRGDIVECVRDYYDQFSKGTLYAVDCPGERITVDVDDCGDRNGIGSHFFKFHSRQVTK